ncbi:hypothetical protein [Nocardioides speluncae]|uniref:hypothetical protein n=1 Tax=Nocardioides speluncae TaxID=2670337 RepID=UPI000D692B72|nr:hypothetical protein [Nocardioides speluncae]
MRPPASADYDLEVYDDRAMTNRLGSSGLSSGVVDFVAVDGNQGHQPLGDLYPRARHLNGDGEYVIEADYDSDLIGVGDTTAPMSAQDVVEMYDLCTSEKRTITVTPGDVSQDAELFVMSSTPGPGANSVKSRASAFRTSMAGEPGQAETVEIPATGDTQCYGVVLVNKAGSGSYTVNVS